MNHSRLIITLLSLISILSLSFAQTADFNAHYPYQDPRFNTPIINPHPEEAMVPTITGLDDPQLLFHVIGEGWKDILGTFMDGVGDINQDGYDDVILATIYTVYAYLYYGDNPMDSIPDITFGDGIAQYFRPTNVGDVNGDSIQDFVLSRLLFGDLEEVWFYYGGTGLDSVTDSIGSLG
ncbi:MAG: VCBS repeat-containing protein [candidate division Zixibacteria bacterium]|nr:VCBS repeat-containing protein [Candidatus Tariuqbacter arcticus]